MHGDEVVRVTFLDVHRGVGRGTKRFECVISFEPHTDSREVEAVDIPTLQRKKTESQRGSVICPRSRSWEEWQLALETQSAPKVRELQVNHLMGRCRLVALLTALQT